MNFEIILDIITTHDNRKIEYVYESKNKKRFNRHVFFFKLPMPLQSGLVYTSMS